MYQQQGLHDWLYIMLYGATATTAVLACLYLLFRQANFISPATEPPLALRRWTAALIGACALSHVWWLFIDSAVMRDDPFLRNAINIGLDSVTLVSLMMGTLLNMLQDRRRPLWPIAVAMIPVAAVVGVGIAGRHEAYEDILRNYLLALAVTFIIYMVFAIRQYDQWLRDNYANMRRKEMWQSIVLLGVILLMFCCDKANFGGMMMEYTVQVNTLVIIILLVWRVETLETLQQKETSTKAVDDCQPKEETNSIEAASTGDTAEEDEEPVTRSTEVLDRIGLLLKTHCEDQQLYLQYDLTRDRLCAVIGTNRTYLSAYFKQQGITYNDYINRQRIAHFQRLYHQTVAEHRPYSIQALALKSGFLTYRNFGMTFKKHIGLTASEWMEQQKQVGAS